MKTFFGPTWKMFLVKVVGAFVIFNVVNFFAASSQMMVADYYYEGFPFKYREEGGMCPSGPCPSDYYLQSFVFDVIIWFLVACLIITLISLAFRKGQK